MTRIRLLFVNGDGATREAVRTALARRGFLVTMAEGGDAALESFRVARPEAVVIALTGRPADDRRTSKRMRMLDPTVPLVAVAATRSAEAVRAGIRLGAADVIATPLEPAALAARLRGLVGAGAPQELRERTVRAMMVPVSLYQRIRADQTVREAAEALLRVQMHRMSDDDTDRGRRTLLVFDRTGVFLGLIRAQDIVRIIVSAWRTSARRSAAPGTFLAEGKAAAGLSVGDAVRPVPAIDVHATVMQAADLIASHHLSHLAVTRKGKLVGLLRPEDLYQEVVSPGVADPPARRRS